MSVCEYLKWADMQDIQLAFTYISSDVDNCNSVINSYYSYILDTDEKLGYLGANQFMKQTLDQISHINGQLQYKHTFFYLQNAEDITTSKSNDEKKANNAADKPVYFVYVTDELYQRMILSGIVGSDNRKAQSSIFG